MSAPEEKQAGLHEFRLQVEAHHGPLPHPFIIEGYEKVVTGGAERILKMAEKEQEHRHYMKRRGLFLQSAHIGLGQLMAFLIGMTGILAGAYLVLHDKQISGFATFVVSLGALVGIYLHQQRQKEEAPEKDRDHDTRHLRAGAHSVQHPQ